MAWGNKGVYYCLLIPLKNCFDFYQLSHESGFVTALTWTLIFKIVWTNLLSQRRQLYRVRHRGTTKDYHLGLFSPKFRKFNAVQALMSSKDLSKRLAE